MAETTGKVKSILQQECKTTLALVPPGTTGKVQPFDVAFNSEFKKSVDRLATEHMIGNQELFISGKPTADDRRVLFTKWVGQAWQETSRRLREAVVRSFFKCGIALPTSGSKNNKINIDRLSDYSIGELADVEELTFYSDSDDDISD